MVVDIHGEGGCWEVAVCMGRGLLSVAVRQASLTTSITAPDVDGPHEETAPLQGPSLVSGLVDGGMLPEGEPSHPNTLPGCLGRRLSRFSWAGTPVGVQARVVTRRCALAFPLLGAHTTPDFWAMVCATCYARLSAPLAGHLPSTGLGLGSGC